MARRDHEEVDDAVIEAALDRDPECRAYMAEHPANRSILVGLVRARLAAAMQRRLPN